MNIPNLDNFNASINEYISDNATEIQNLISDSQFNIEELRQKGEAFLSTELLTGPLTAKGFSMSGLTIDDVAQLPGLIVDAGTAVGGAVIDTGIAVGTKAVQLGTKAYQLGSKAVESLKNPVASRLETGDVDPEFGISEEGLMNTLNAGVAKIPSSSSSFISRGASSDIADMSAMRAPVYGSDVARIGEALPEEVNSVVPVSNVAEGALVPAENIAINLGKSAVSEVAGATADATTAGLETAGAVLDSTGLGAPVGIVLGLIGAVTGGYGLFEGFKDMFEHKSDNISAMVPNISIPEFQSS
jgi:hypothetical protein